MVAISSWFDTIVSMGGSFVGYMYGEGVTGFSENTIWWINIANGPLTTFLVLLSFNGEAFTDCSWHGIWKPERPKSKKVVAEHKMLDEKAELKRQHAALRGKEVTRLTVLWAELKYFTTAFNDTCYRNLWFQGLIGTMGGIIMWQFGFYWYQDAFPYGYRFFGYKLASTAASAISISGELLCKVTSFLPAFFNSSSCCCDVAPTPQLLPTSSAQTFTGIISQFMFIVIVPFARPDYWRDRIGGRPLLIWVNIMGFPLIGCYIYWYFTGSPWMYTIHLLWSLW